MEAVLAFELGNRASFARSINDRVDEFYETLSGHLAGFTATGSCVVAGDPGLKSTLALADDPT